MGVSASICKGLTILLVTLAILVALVGGIPTTASADGGHFCGPVGAVHPTGYMEYEQVRTYRSSWFRDWAVIDRYQYLHYAGVFVRVDSFARYGCRMVVR